MAKHKEIKDRAYYANGIYMSVLEELIKTQTEHPHLICYLQPYDNSVITQLRDLTAEKGYTWQLYASTSTYLSHVSYVGDIVGWEHKKELSAERRTELNKHMANFQQGEKKVYEDGVNIIAIKNLRRFTNPIPKERFLKIEDSKPFVGRPLPGKYGYVLPIDLQNYETSTILINSDLLEKELSVNVAEKKKKSLEEIYKELIGKPTKPERIQIVSTGFNRNPNVVAYVIKRANGICELCNKPAPFKKPDGTPYLEVHHWMPLSEGGEDTVINAAALCPNCHKEAHFGTNNEKIKLYRTIQ